jgi:protein tyrosine phosphatase (PTP) superfamily phosphohydrolase (DUF442 family)
MVTARQAALGVLMLSICFMCSCDGPTDKNQSTGQRKDGTHQKADRSSGKAAPKSAMAHSDGPKPSNLSETQGLENVIEISPELVSGSAPEGELAFDALAKRGIKTIVSVDGTTPNLEEAHKHGIRYVHLPIGYHGIDRSRQLEIARAVRDLPHPVYVHCLHGKHRGPAAAASAAVALGVLTPDEGVDFLKQAGTSKSYPGLYGCVHTLEQVDSAQLAKASDEFPEIAPVPGFVKAMAATQTAVDNLKDIRDAGWTAPPHHPDIVATAEASRLENLLRAMQNDAEVAKHPDDFAEMLRASWVAAQALEQSLHDDLPKEQLTTNLDMVGTSCKTCHNIYRNTK